MEDSLLLEGNGYYCHCSVFEVKPGAWGGVGAVRTEE